MDDSNNEQFDKTSDENCSINDDDDEYILSLAWKQSVLSAVYFSKKTMNVFLVKEVDDFKPGL